MLDLEGISAGYGTTTILRDVHLTVPDSSVVALIGANGAGKSTLLRVASGALRPWSGRILLDDADITTRPPHRFAIAGVCHVPEGHGVFPPLSVRDNLLLFSRKGEERAGLERAVDAFPDLGDRLNQPAGTMSGGQQQMLALARAYVSGARVILLDEVSMGLAPIIVDEIFAFLDRIRAEGVSLLVVEQYVNKVLAIADYVYILGRGEVIFAGDTAELAGEDVFGHYLGIEATASTTP
jgi:branched-chain amino acid transport system ATP-binding protein